MVSANDNGLTAAASANCGNAAASRLPVSKKNGTAIRARRIRVNRQRIGKTTNKSISSMLRNVAIISRHICKKRHIKKAATKLVHSTLENDEVVVKMEKEQVNYL